MSNSEWKKTSLALLRKYSRLFTNRQVLVIADFIEQVSENPDDFEKEKK
jgi:adenine-specific DNA methylase